MRQISLSLFTLLILSISCKQKNNSTGGSYTITGKIEGATAGETIICRQQTTEGKPDTATIAQDGSFSFKGTIDEPIAASIYFPATVAQGQQQAINIFVEPGNIYVVAKQNDLLGATIKGGENNKELQDVMAITKPYGIKMMALSDTIRRLYGAKNIAAVQSLQHSAIALEKEQNNVIEKLIRDNPKTYASAYLAYQLNSYDTNLDTAQVAFNNLDAGIQASYYGKKLKSVIDAIKATAIGTNAPDFTAMSIDGKDVSLSSFKGKYLLLDFWASWCGPCRQENPNVVKAYTQFKDKNFTILSFSLDDNKDAWQQAVANDKLTWTQVSDLKGWSSSVGNQYGIQSIPSNFLLDPTGKIIGKDLRGDELIKALSSTLK
jgi:peroxiredoxin